MKRMLAVTLNTDKDNTRKFYSEKNLVSVSALARFLLTLLIVIFHNAKVQLTQYENK